jgi:hypothetical protein
MFLELRSIEGSEVLDGAIEDYVHSALDFTNFRG